MQVQEDPG